MTTAFQSSAFQNDAFQIDEGAAAAVTGVSGGGNYRYFTPAPPKVGSRLKRKIDRAVVQEAKLKAALLEYETTGVDIAILNDIAIQIKEIQLTILRLALESALAAQYIEWKRKMEEDEDVKFIMSIL
jgi:hypothetical protein